MKTNPDSHASTNRNSHYQPVPLELERSINLDRSSRNGHAATNDHQLRHGRLRLIVSFWMLGLLNNASYVLMIACAKSMSEGGTALIFLANIVPSLAIKLSAPYWFDGVSYYRRFQAATLCMMTSFALVASTAMATPSIDEHDNLVLMVQLVGVAFGSAQIGLGEASLLALTGKFDASSTFTSDEDHPSPSTTTKKKGLCLTAFSSGTGMAGVFGFFWKWLFTDVMGFSMATAMWLAMSWAWSYWLCFRYTHSQEQPQEEEEKIINATQQYCYEDQDDDEDTSVRPLDKKVPDDEGENDDVLPHEGLSLTPPPIRVTPIAEMTSRQRFRLVLGLWPYMVPLFVVYMAEYALQAGTWTAIGFPLDDPQARDRFYEFSNWMYQAGVFVSRSSGVLWEAPPPLWALWLMPTLQFLNLVFFCQVAAKGGATGLYQPWILYSGALYSGLLGGAVYIHGYKRVCQDIPVEHIEFSLSATSVSEGLGILVADSMGLVIQSCLYQVHGLEGALISCPIDV